MADTQIGIRLSVSGDAQVAEAAGRAARAVEGIGRAGQVSAAQTAAAMRTLPAQFTDIATSLAGGQSPLTVLLQQGGQIKDAFGGVGAAARALGGYVAGLVNPFTAAAAVAGGLALAYRAGASEAEAFRQTLILSGNVAGVTDGRLASMSATIKEMGAGTQGRAAEILASIAGSAEIGADGMVRFTAAALRLESVGGPAAEKTAEAFRSLGRDPLAAALKLNETTNFLSASVYEQVRALEAQGRTTEAARLAQEAYAGAIESRTPQLAASLGYVERAWNAVKAATKGAVDAALNFGRGNTLDGQIAALRERIETARTGIYSRDKVPALQQELALLQEQQRMLQRGAEADAARAVTVKAMAEWDKEGAKYQAAGKKLADEILLIRRNGLEAGKTEAQINERIAEAVERAAAPRSGGGAKPAERHKEAEAAARTYMAALSGLAGMALEADAKAQGLTKTQARLREIQADPAWAAYSRQQQEQIITQAAVAQAAEDVATATTASAAAAREYGKYLADLERGAATVGAQVQTLRDEENAARLAADGRMSLREAIEEVTIARLQEQQVAVVGNPGAVEAIQREIDARTELRGLIAGQEQRKATEAAAKDATREWGRAADQIQQSLADALMAGGKSGAKYITGLFRSMVLRPIVNAIVSPVAGAVTGALGFAGTAAAAGAAGAGAGAVGAAAGIGGLAAGMGAFGTGLASGLSAWGAGGSVTGLLSTGVGGIFSGGIASGLGTLAGALGPIALGVGALVALAKSLDNSGTPHVGAQAMYSAAGGLQTVNEDPALGMWMSPGYVNDNAQTAVTNFAKGIVGMLDRAATTFGKQAGFSVSTGFADDSSSDGAWGSLVIRRGQQSLLNWNDSRQSGWAPRIFADGEAGAKQYAAALAKDVRGVLDAIGLPGWATEMLNSLGEAPSIEQLGQTVEQINATSAALVSLGRVLPQLSGLADSAVTELLRTFGGAQAMSSAASGYLQAIYTDSERLEIATRGLDEAMGKLGLQVPATRAAYRQLVDAQDLTTEAGRNTYAALLTLAPAFAQVTTAAEQAAAQQTAAFEQALQEQASAAARIAQERADLEGQLLELQGDTAALRQLEIDALDPANRALQARIYALADEKRRLDELASAGQGISDFLRELAGGTSTGAPSLPALRDIYQADLAAARAGDAQASGRIPASARALLEAVRNNASTALEVAQESSRIATQLQALPATAAYQGRALGVAAPLDVSAPIGTFAGAQVGPVGGDRGVLDELRALRDQLQALRAVGEATASHTNSAARKLQELIDRGITVQTDADSPLATVAV